MSTYDTEHDNVPEPPPLLPTTTATNSYTPTRNSNCNSTSGYARIDRQPSPSIRLGNNDNSNSGRYTRGSFGPAFGRFTDGSVSALNGLKEALPGRIQPYFWLGLWFGFVMLTIGLIAGFHSKIFGALEAFASFIKGLGPLGPLVIMTCLFATSFPPVIGYSSIVTMSGYVYGFTFGFLIAFSSALAGSIVCFYFCRRWFKVQVRKLMAKNKNLKSIVRTVEKRGFRLLVLIRLAPYPFNIMNAVLSTTHIPLHTYSLATAISLLKLTLHVYIGSTLSSLTGGDDDGGQDDGSGEPKTPSGGHGKAVKIIVMVLGMILGIGVGGYVWIVAKREIAVSEASRMERRRRRRRESLTRAMDEHASSAGSGTNGRIELSEGSFLDRERDLLSASSDVVGGYNVGYHEEDDGDGHEHQSLFVERDRQRQQNQQQQGDWRNVGVNVDSSTESDEDSDFLDDDDDDDDEERLIGLESRHGYLDEGEDDAHRPRGDHRAEDEGEALSLDFSAHHAESMDSPWQDAEPVPSTNNSK